MPRNAIIFLVVMIAIVGGGAIYLLRKQPRYYQMDPRCTAAYSAASDAADSARVDSLLISFPSSERPMSCGYQRQRVELYESSNPSRVNPGTA